jgi:hypothetical protein
MNQQSATSHLHWYLLGLICFISLATANGAGYRFGVSDQAFYVPAVERALDPAAFPRDASLIDAQGRLMLIDEVLAAAVRTGVSIEWVFFIAYLISLALLYAGLMLAAARIYGLGVADAGTRRHVYWAMLAAGAALTLRHHIPGTSANSLEPHFHPRLLAFAIGVLAMAALLHRRRWLAVPLLAVAAVVHLTTAAWFGILLGLALAILDARLRVFVIAAAAIVICGITWALATGPLQSSLATMDDVWLLALATKDSLFASTWAWHTWLANLGLLGLLWWTHRRRVRSGAARPEDAALVWGATALVAVFLLTLPLVEMRLAMPVQLQISRIFWLVDVVATLYLVSLFGRHTRTLAIVLVLAAVGRGAYIMLVERPERPLVEIALDDTRWHDAMAWIRRQPSDLHVLADPGHAWRFGTSVRVSGGRDVFLEDVKDAAIAIYSRDVAARVVERAAAIGDFATLTPERARALAAEYDLDVLVTDRAMELPVAYRNAQFTIYNLTR